MFAPSHTLLLNTGKVLARIDLAGKRRPRVQNVWTRPAIETLSLVAMATTALKLGPRRAGRVWVLSADFWTEPVSLSADLVAMLSGEELLQALALEAEANSGISAFESRIAALESQPSIEGTWWVTQVPAVDVEQLSDAVRVCGARLAGLAHPAAAALTAAAPVKHSQSSEAVALSQPHIASVGDWCEQSLAMQIDCDTNESDNALAWQQLVDQWSSSLSRGPALAPLVIAAAGAPLSQSQQVAIGGALVLLTACACATIHQRTRHQLSRADSAIAQLEQQQAAHDKMLSQLKSSESRLAQLRQEVSQADVQRQKLERDLTVADATHAQQSLRWVALLDALAESSNSDCWLQRLESTPARAVLTGLAVENAAAHRFASGLERALRDSGWVVLPAETKLDANNLVSFKIVLEAKFAAVDLDGDSKLSQLETAVLAAAPRAVPNESSGSLAQLGEPPQR